MPVEPRAYIAKRRRRQSVLQYQNDLKKYHDDMEAWTIDRKESMEARQVEHEDIENTMIDLIRVFVSENGKVPRVCTFAWTRRSGSSESLSESVLTWTIGTARFLRQTRQT